MAKYKPCNDQQMVMLPISLQDQLVPGTLEHTIREVVDKHLDLSVFDGRYNNDETGAAAIHPNFYAPHETAGGCAVEVVCTGAQSRQNPGLWEAEVALPEGGIIKAG